MGDIFYLPPSAVYSTVNHAAVLGLAILGFFGLFCGLAWRNVRRQVRYGSRTKENRSLKMELPKPPPIPGRKPTTLYEALKSANPKLDLNNPLTGGTFMAVAGITPEMEAEWRKRYIKETSYVLPSPKESVEQYLIDQYIFSGHFGWPQQNYLRGLSILEQYATILIWAEEWARERQGESGINGQK